MMSQDKTLYEMFVKDVSSKKSIKNTEETQKRDVENLAKLENKLRKMLSKTFQGDEGYKKFIIQIVVINKNLLLCKPYFREKFDNFKGGVYKAIKSGDHKKLQKYKANFKLLNFVMEKWIGPVPEDIAIVYKELKELRHKIIQDNIPLAINRAQIFARTSHGRSKRIEDLVSVSIAGLISGVDKWRGPYRPVWRSNCIAYSIGNLTKECSEIEVTMSPTDEANLYRVKSVMVEFGVLDPKIIAKIINSRFQKSCVDQNYIATLIESVKLLSLDKKAATEDGELSFELKDSTQDVESSLAEKQVMLNMLENIKKLPMLERKLLKLKGVL